MPDGRLVILDVFGGVGGYDVSVHLFSNSGEDNGAYYIDMIAHRNHTRWGKLIEVIRSNIWMVRNLLFHRRYVIR